MKFLTITLFAILFPIAAAADDAELYDPKVNEDEGLIRVLNLTGKNSTLAINGAPAIFRKIPPYNFTDYIVTKEGRKTLQLGAASLDVVIERGATSTFTVLPNGKIKALHDAVIGKKGKSLITLYNFTDNLPLTLKTANGKTTIIEPVQPASSNHREINPVKIAPAVFSDQSKIKALDPIQLKRNTPYSIAIWQHNDRTVAIGAHSGINTRKR